MLVHVSEGSMDQERAREPTHGLRGWQPCLKVTYVYEGVHVPSRHVIPLLIPSTSSGVIYEIAPCGSPPETYPYRQNLLPITRGWFGVRFEALFRTLLMSRAPRGAAAAHPARTRPSALGCELRFRTASRTRWGSRPAVAQYGCVLARDAIASRLM